MTLRKNITSLLIVQIFTYIVPLLQFPYLSRVLGVEQFGSFIFLYSFISFFLVFTNLGIELLYPQKNIEGEDQNVFFTNVFLLKALVAIISIVALLIFFINFNFFEKKIVYLFLISFSVILNAFSISWFYEGKEILYIYSRLVIFARAVTFIFIFIFVKSEEDFIYVLVSFILNISLIVFPSYFYAIKKFNLHTKKASTKYCISLLKNLAPYFFSRVGVSLYVTAGSFFVGILSESHRQVALYGVAYQVYAAGAAVFSAMTGPLLPYMARTKNYAFFKKMIYIAMSLTGLGMLFGWIFGSWFLSFVFGHDYLEAKGILDVFMATIFFSVLGMFLGYPALVPIGGAMYANRSVIYAGLIYLIAVFIIGLLGDGGAKNIAIAYLLSDIFMMLYRLYFYIKLRKSWVL